MESGAQGAMEGGQSRDPTSARDRPGPPGKRRAPGHPSSQATPSPCVRTPAPSSPAPLSTHQLPTATYNARPNLHQRTTRLKTPDPLCQQLDPLVVSRRPSELRHRLAGIGRSKPVDHDRALWLARLDGVTESSSAATGRDRRLAHSESAKFGFGPVEQETRRIGWPLLVVAVAAVDVEIGTGPLIERTGRRIVEHRQARRFGRSGCVAQVTHLRPALELVLCTVRIGEIRD